LRWDQVYASTFGVLEVGIPGTGGFSIVLDNPNGALDYLPAVGPAGTLTSDLVNPTSSSAGSFGGDVVALELNSDFSSAGFLPGVTPLGSLSLCSVPGFPNLTVSAFLSLANTALGGGGGNLANFASVTNAINAAFVGGSPSTFAQEHLVNGACPGGWAEGAMLTYNQNAWGEPSSTAGSLLGFNFDSIYGSGLEVGISGTGGFSIVFSSPGSVFSYLPAIGPIGTLTADLVDPTSTSSGSFGGIVVALTLNIDFSDANIIAGSSNLGDLRICGFSLLPAVNDQTVRQFSTTANTILGGGAGAFGAEEAAAVANLINNAFTDGNPSSFAQDHLVIGTSP
jgi:hypothetical protein